MEATMCSKDAPMGAKDDPKDAAMCAKHAPMGAEVAAVRAKDAART